MSLSSPRLSGATRRSQRYESLLQRVYSVPRNPSLRSLRFCNDVQEVRATEELHRRALDWAERLKVPVAYDPAYLAVAEHLGAAFWTADNKLYKKMRALNIDWIHDISASTRV
jgi:predicted nucleic acid-binding protein